MTVSKTVIFIFLDVTWIISLLLSVKVENICEQLLLFRYNNIKIQQSAFTSRPEPALLN